MNVSVSMTVNGNSVSAEVEARTLLVDFLRVNQRLTGTHVGCDTSQCGACVVHVNGKSVKSCTMLAVQANHAEVATIEGVAINGQLHPMQEAFRENHGLQCGFCTPGVIMSALDLVSVNADPSEREIREWLEGNLCRCTGYHNYCQIHSGWCKSHEGGVNMGDTGIGASVRRKEDLRFVRGSGKYTDDMNLEGQAYAYILRSPHAHASIRSIDTSAARASDGVIAVFTSEDMTAVGGIPLRLAGSWQGWQSDGGT